MNHSSLAQSHNQKKTIVWMDNSRILAIFSVIFLHVAACVVTGNNVGSEYWWIGNLYDSLARWCVPLFVMVSGALLLKPGKKESLSEFYKKRFAKILVPILFWSGFFLCWTQVKAILHGNQPSPLSIVMNLLSGAPYYHMWFLYMIAGLYLFTPFFRKIIAHSTKQELVVLVCLMFAMAAINYAYEAFHTGVTRLFINWFLFFIPYFFMGHLISEASCRFSKYMLLIIFFLSCIATSLGCYFTSGNDPTKEIYFYGYLSITVIPMSISIMLLLKNWSIPLLNMIITKKLSSLTLGVYLVHPLLLELLLLKKIGIISFHPIVSVPMISILVFASSFLLVWIIHHIPYLNRTI